MLCSQKGLLPIASECECECSVVDFVQPNASRALPLSQDLAAFDSMAIRHHVYSGSHIHHSRLLPVFDDVDDLTSTL